MSQVEAAGIDVDPLRAQVEGKITVPGDEAYDAARSVWNGMIDRYPAVVVSCSSTADVVAAVGFARRRGLVIAVRCGSHSTPGHSTCDGGLVVDLRPMNKVTVDAGAGTARVGGGTVWAELDAATQEHGLAVTGGRVSDTGVGGLSLGSGSGWLERVYGLTAESLNSAQVVTADGRVVTASKTENPDLFWGLRGGGGNFGVVTEFEFQLHPVGPILSAGMLLYPRAQAGEVIRHYRDFIAQAPVEVGGGVALITGPPEPFVPPELQGQPAVGVIYCYIGPPPAGEELAKPLKEFGSPMVDLIQPMPYVALQQMLDGGNPRGVHEYFKIDSLKTLSNEAIDTVVSQGNALPAPFGQLILAPMGGKMGRADAEGTALSVPDAEWQYFCLAMWMDSAEDERHTAWARGFHEAMRPFGIDTTLPNFIEPDEGMSRVRSSFGDEAFGRLVALKRQWDPENVFRLNQNIPVSGA